VEAAKKIFSLLFIAFWAVVTSHCSLETIPGLDFLACAPHVESAPEPSHCGDQDGCATVESGLYKTESTQVFSTPPSADLLLTIFTVIVPVPFLDPSSRALIQSDGPPDLSSSWIFVSRAALPPRAPSLLS
jgi:hypothetical protein